MGKLELKKIFLAAAFSTAVIAVSAQDRRTAEQITLNAAAAAGLEEAYFILNDTIEGNRMVQLKWTALRASLRNLDELERTTLKNFGRENRMYKRALREVERLAENAQRLLKAAKKNPENFAYYRDNMALMMATGTESLNNMIRLAMKSKVQELKVSSGTPNGSTPVTNGTANRNIKDDSYNLLTQIDRLRLMEDCIGELRTMNQVMRRVVYKLETEINWAYEFRKVHYHMFRPEKALVSAFEQTLNDINHFDPF